MKPANIDPKELRALAELVVRNLGRISEMTKGHPVDVVRSTRCYDALGRLTSETLDEVEGPRFTIDMDGTVTQRNPDGTETVIATLE